MHARFLNLKFLLGRGGEVLQDADREGAQVNDERLGVPSGKSDVEGQTEVPASLAFVHAWER